MKMNIAYITEIAENLPFDKNIPIYECQGFQIYFFRPSKLTSGYKGYDKKKNFQIFLKEPNKKAYKPYHLQLLLDLHFMAKEITISRNLILEAFDKIFYGEDALEAIGKLYIFKYTQIKTPIDINAILALSFLVEQNISYRNKSNFSPPSLYIQGWIRAFIDSEKPLDHLCHSICYKNTPAVKYTCQDDKKHAKYNPNSMPLWYKEESYSETNNIFLFTPH